MGNRPSSIAEIPEFSRLIGFKNSYLEFLDSFYFAGRAEREILAGLNPVSLEQDDDDRRKRFSMLEEEPPRMGEREDGWLAGMATHLSLEFGLGIPEWCKDGSRVLRKPWHLRDIPEFMLRNVLMTPPGFKIFNIFTGKEPLERASKHLKQAWSMQR